MTLILILFAVCLVSLLVGLTSGNLLHARQPLPPVQRTRLLNAILKRLRRGLRFPTAQQKKTHLTLIRRAYTQALKEYNRSRA